jgi:hypothetical protein
VNTPLHVIIFFLLLFAECIVTDCNLHLQHRTTYQPKEETKNNNRREIRTSTSEPKRLEDHLHHHERIITVNFNIFYILYFIYKTNHSEFNVLISYILCLITCIWDHGSKYLRHTSSCVRTADPW